MNQNGDEFLYYIPHEATNKFCLWVWLARIGEFDFPEVGIILIFNPRPSLSIRLWRRDLRIGWLWG